MGKRKELERKEEFRGYLYVTVDTEIDADVHWVKGCPESFSSVMQGIPYILRPIWNRNKINPIYFISPEVLDNPECCKILRNEIQMGALIGAHLHAEYIDPYKRMPCQGEYQGFPCIDYPTEIERKKLENLRKLIIERLGVIPVWYRAARFGADQDTMLILSELGFLYDSSYTPHINWENKGGPDHSKVPNGSYQITIPGRNDSITEYPVTIGGKRWGLIGKLLPDNWMFYKWLRPTHMTYTEQKKLIRSMRKNNIKDIVMMFHSMEVMINKSLYVRNKEMQKYFLWRLEKTLQYANRIGYGGEIE